MSNAWHYIMSTKHFVGISYIYKYVFIDIYVYIYKIYKYGLWAGWCYGGGIWGIARSSWNSVKHGQRHKQALQAQHLKRVCLSFPRDVSTPRRLQCTHTFPWPFALLRLWGWPDMYVIPPEENWPNLQLVIFYYLCTCSNH